MAKVPVYDGPQVRSNQLQPAYQSATDVSSGLKAVGAGLATVGDAGTQYVRREAQTEAWDAQSAITEDFLNWQAEARKNAQGSNAKGHAGATREWWDKVKDERFSKLSPMAQQLAAKSLSTARLSALEGSASYENQQLDVGERQALASTTVTASSAAVAAGPGRAQPLIEDLVKNIRAYGAKKGLDVEGQVLNVTTGVHANIIAGLQKSDPAAAERYFIDNKAQIDGSRHDEIAKGLEVADGQRKAQTYGDEVMSAGMTLDAALVEARKRFSGDAQVRAVAEVKTRFAEQEAVDTLATKKLTKTAWSQLMATGSINKVDPTTMTALREKAPEEERQMRDWLDAKRRQAKAERDGDQSPDEFGRYYTYRRMAMENPAGFSALDLTKIQPYVSKAQLNHLTEIQGGISKSDAKAMERQRQVKATVDMVKGSILDAGIDLTPKEGTKHATEYANFMGTLTQALDDAQRAQPEKPLTPDQMKAIGMNMVKVGYEQGSGIFGLMQTTKRGYQIAAEGDPTKTYVATRYKDIPAEVRKQLETDAPKAKPGQIYGNAAEREAAIERAYQRGVEQGRFK